MHQVMVRYRVKSDRVKENEDLVEAVYAELHERRPATLRYETVRLGDGVSFVHLHRDQDPGGAEALTQLPTFRRFQAGIAERCEEPPVVMEATEIGRYAPSRQ